MTRKTILFAWALLTAGLLLQYPALTFARQKPQALRVLLIKTSDNPFYTRGAEGIVNGLKGRGFKPGDRIQVSTVTLSGNEGADQKLVRDRVAARPALTVTLGTDATRLTQAASPAGPIVFSMILDPVRLGVANSLDTPGGQFTGTTLLVSAGKQLEAFIQAVPRVKRIGFLYTEGDATSSRFIEEAREAAARLRIEIVPQSVAAMGGSTRAALNVLLDNVDSMWLIPDPASTGAAALSQTIELAKERKLPLLGSSSAMAHRGALLALSADIPDLADITAEMAARILDGTATPATTRIRGPRKTILSVNLVAAKAHAIKIPDSILHLADEVIDGEGGSAP